MKEFESFDRIGTTPHRSYYIPFAEKDNVGIKHGIVDRTTSSRFTPSSDVKRELVVRSTMPCLIPTLSFSAKGR